MSLISLMFYYTIYVSNWHPHCLKYSYNCFGVLVLNSSNCVSSTSLLNGWLFSSLCFIACSVIFLLTTRHEFYLFLVLDSFAFPWTFLNFVPRYNNVTWKQFDSLRSCLYDLLDGVGDGLSLGIDLFLTSEARPFQILYPMTYGSWGFPIWLVLTGTVPGLLWTLCTVHVLLGSSLPGLG